MGKPNPTIRIEFHDCKNVIADMKTFDKMEKRMLKKWNENLGSLYYPTDKESEALKRNMQEIYHMKGHLMNKFDEHMFLTVIDEIGRNSIPTRGYNKKALLHIIKCIKEMWIDQYPAFIRKAEAKNSQMEEVNNG